MSDTQETYEAAAERLDRALQRLEASVRSLNGRVRTHARIEADTQKLLAERAKFASDLDKVSARAKRLDEASGEVARRLVAAMETVNNVLARDSLMPEVNVEIDGKKYRMACEEGQEDHLLGLADRLNRTVVGLKGSFGEIGDNQLVVMAGIAVLDELGAAEQRIEALKRDIAELTTAGRDLTLEAEELEQKFARRLAEAARKIESIATALDETGAPASPAE